MLLPKKIPNVLAVVVWSVLSGVVRGSTTAPTISCTSSSTPGLTDEERVCMALVTIEDLADAESIQFTGMDGQDGALFIKSRASRHDFDDSSQASYWFGEFEMDNGSYGGSASFYRASETSPVFGSFTILTMGYSLKQTIDGEMQVEATTLPNQGPPPEVNVSQLTASRDRNNTRSTGVKLTQFSSRNEVATQDLSSPSGQGFSVGTAGPDGGRNLRIDHDRTLQSTVVVDVVWIVTNRAFCELRGLSFGCESTDSNFQPMLDALELQVMNMNRALSEAVVDTRINTVGYATLPASSGLDFTPYSPPGESNPGLLFLFTSTEIADYKEEKNADLVAMVSARSGTGTLGVALAPGTISNSEGTTRGFASYTIQHELGTLQLRAEL